MTHQLESLIGHDKHALAAREQMPNPSDYKGEKIEVPLREEREFKYRLDLRVFNPTEISYRTLHFHKVVISLGTGGIFVAWEYDGDRKIYL